MILALKEMKKEKLRFLMIILVTALIAYLVYFLSSLAYGLAEKNKTAIEFWNAEGVVLAKSANKSIYGSMIDSDLLNEKQNEIGINLSSATIEIEKNKELSDVVFLAYDEKNEEILAPLIEGRYIKNDDEIVISKSLQEKEDLKTNDKINITNLDKVFKIVGITEESDYNTAPLVYIDRKTASVPMMMFGKEIPQNAEISEKFTALIIQDKKDIEELDDSLEFIPLDEFIDQIPGYKAQVLTFGLMIISLSLIAAIIIGIFMYILTMQKKSIFAVLKIQGYKNSYITSSVILQSVLVLSIGFTLGFVLTIISKYFLPNTVPFALYWPLLAGVSLFSLFCSLFGSLFSARSILKIDPLEAL